jgi:hypothetical protein
VFIYQQETLIFSKSFMYLTLQKYKKNIQNALFYQKYILKTHYFTIIPHSKRTILHKNKRHFSSLTQQKSLQLISLPLTAYLAYSL